MEIGLLCTLVIENNISKRQTKYIMITQNFFQFKKSERVGVLVLLLFMVSMFLVLKLFSFPNHQKTYQFVELEKETTKIKVAKANPISTNKPIVFKKNNGTKVGKKTNVNKTNQVRKQAKKFIQKAKKAKTNQLFFFDPNTATQADFKDLGLAPKVIQTIQNYKSKGGFFKEAADFKKIYGLSSADFDRLSSFIKIKQRKIIKPIVNKQKQSKPKVQVDFKPFNPNTIKKEELIKMGISSKVANTWIRFREAGARFSKKQQIKKIYGITEQQYQQLEPYIQFDTQDTIKQVRKNRSKKTENKILVNINKATAQDFQKLKGIGSAYSRRIINFRDKLGGFYTIKQVGETYGIPDSTFQTIKPFLQLEDTKIRQINLNTTDVDTLKAHPYIDWNKAKVIISYRKMHGTYKSVEDIKQIHLITDEVFARISPYLTI